MKNKKLIGWIIFAIGLICIFGSYYTGYGIEAQITMAIVAGLGLWLALKKGNKDVPPQNPPTMPQ